MSSESSRKIQSNLRWEKKRGMLMYLVCIMNVYLTPVMRINVPVQNHLEQRIWSLYLV